MKEKKSNVLLLKVIGNQKKNIYLQKGKNKFKEKIFEFNKRRCKKN
jgi:hypothetical protein